MPSEERATRSAEKGSDRCDLHPGSPSVAACDGCGRPLCLSCATPVRGRVLGAECLAEALGPDAPREAARPNARPRSLRSAVAGTAFAVAFASTILPWSRFGEGSGAFGGWGRSPRWSLLAAVAATLGLVLWAVRGRLHARRARLDAALAALGGLVAIGAVLAAVRPPSFTHAWFAPWIAAPAGIVALVASIPRPAGGKRASERI